MDLPMPEDPPVTNTTFLSMALGSGNKKRAGRLHRTATTTYACCVPALGDSVGAGRVELARWKYTPCHIWVNPISFLISDIKDHTMKFNPRMMPKPLSMAGMLLFFLACGEDADPSKHFSLKLGDKNPQQHQKLTVSLENKKGLEISNLRYFMDG